MPRSVQGVAWRLATLRRDTDASAGFEPYMDGTRIPDPTDRHSVDTFYDWPPSAP